MAYFTVQSQANALSFKNSFFVMSVIIACLSPLPFIMRRPSLASASSRPLNRIRHTLRCLGLRQGQPLGAPSARDTLSVQLSLTIWNYNGISVGMPTAFKSGMTSEINDLLTGLQEAIDQAISESSRINGIVEEMKRSGYDPCLILESSVAISPLEEGHQPDAEAETRFVQVSASNGEITLTRRGSGVSSGAEYRGLNWRRCYHTAHEKARVPRHCHRRRGCIGRRLSIRARAAPLSDSADFELDEVSLADLASGLERASGPPHAWCSSISRGSTPSIGNGPQLGSVLALNPDAAASPVSSTEERKNGKVRGPLHGIPILLKDNIETSDAISTTAGSLALADWRTPQDAFVAARLRAAGAIILGKTNLSEWANFRSTHSTSGWSGRGGQTKNPYALDRNPSGSSSGSGAAASASLCAAAIGTETDGSVTSPHRSMASSASSRPSGWSAARASSPSRPARIPPARWRARSAMSRFC